MRTRGQEPKVEEETTVVAKDKDVEEINRMHPQETRTETPLIHMEPQLRIQWCKTTL